MCKQWFMNMFKKIKVNLVYFNMHKSHFSTLTFFFIDLALISLYFRVVLIFSSFFYKLKYFVKKFLTGCFLTLNWMKIFAYVKHCRSCMLLVPQSHPSSATGKHDIWFSLSGHCVVHLPFMGLIIIWEVLLWCFNCCMP